MKTKIFLITIITLIISYFAVDYLISKNKFLNLKFLISSENRFLIKTQNPKKFLAKESLFDFSSLYKI